VFTNSNRASPFPCQRESGPDFLNSGLHWSIDFGSKQALNTLLGTAARVCKQTLADRIGQEAYWPKEEWLQQLMDWGHPFREFVHYKLAFDARGIALIYKRRYDNPDERSGVLTGFRLPEDTPWEEVEEFKIKYSIVARLNTLRAEEVDPSTAGGITNIDGVFTPFSPNIVHVHISEDRPLSSFTGMRLTGQQKKDLRMYGIAPKGIHVVYTDAEGRPLPGGMPPPRFYERKMEMLAEAEAQLEKLIADHEALFRTLPDPMRDENGTESGEMPRQVEPHRTDVSDPTDTSRPRAQPDRKDRLPPKPLPPPPPDPRKMERWFDLLQELHGGELPRDLRGLREAIAELETIRRTGAEKMRRETTRPDPRTPEEGPISPLPEAQE